jgi:hypothetical protein
MLSPLLSFFWEQSHTTPWKGNQVLIIEIMENTGANLADVVMVGAKMGLISGSRNPDFDTRLPMTAALRIMNALL